MGKRGVKNPATGCTEAALINKITQALRKVTKSTWRKQIILRDRFRKINPTTGQMKNHLRCEICGLEMPEGKKIRKKKKDGSPYKKTSSIYEIDHTDGNPPFTCFEEAPAFMESLFFGEGRVLCWECHRDHGSKGRGK